MRLYRIQSQSIWFDEGWSAYAAVQPTLLNAIHADQTNPPLYYMLLNLLIHYTGDSVLALRWFSALLGLLAVPLAYQLGRRLFNQRTGLASAFLVTCSPLLWWASQEARMYTLLAMLALVAALAFHQLLRRPSRLAWLILWSSELALLYTHNTGPIAALWLNAAALLSWIIYRSLRRPGWRIWFVGQIGVAILWLPWLNLFLRLQEANSAVASAPSLNFDTFSRLWQALWTGVWSMVGQEQTVVILSGIAFVLAVLLIPWRKPAARWLVAHTLILTGGLVIGLMILGNELHGRYLVMVAPLLLVTLGAGLARLRPPLIYPITAVFLAILVVNMHLVTQNPAYQHDDVRSMVQYYADHLDADDTVLAWSYADRYDLAYYWERLGVRARRVTLPEGADREAILPLLPSGGDVALNIWYTQRADYRGMMNCLLSGGVTGEPETFTVYGMSTNLYRSPTLDIPDLQPFNAVAPPAQFSGIGVIPVMTADRALCLPFEMTLLHDTDADLKMALIAHNHHGWEIARADAIFADSAQRTSAALPPGSSLTAYPVLRLPVGAPPGEYPLFLRVYDQQQQPSGYDFTSGGKDLQVDTWQVQQGANWSDSNRRLALPVQVDQPVEANLRLLYHDQTGGILRNGDELRITLLWQGTGTLPTLTLTDTDGRWQVSVPPPSLPQRDDLTLDWRAVIVPPDTPSGSAELRLPDDTVIAAYTIVSIPALYDQPALDTPVGITFPGVGRLVGYSLGSDSFDRSQPVSLKLVWQADRPAAVSYTVFAQLLDENGVLIAQSDSIPAQNSRPTTGWRPGEYILDPHQLQFNTNAAPGRARLIVGLYDAATGQRLPIPPGQDSITLREGIQIQ